MSGNQGKKSTATISENALLAKGKNGFPFKKVFFALLIALVVILLFLLIINIIITSYFEKVTVFDGEWEIDTELMNSMPMYADNVGYYNKSEELHAAYDKVMLSYAQASSDMRNDDEVYNYAIFGTDQFAGSEKRSNADIIMLVSFNERNDHVTYLSFETGMLAYIPGVGVGPIRDAYILGGPMLLVKALELNYGINLDGFFQLDMSAFVELINHFGNMEFDANQKLVDRINGDIQEYNKINNFQGEQAVAPVKLQGNKVFLSGHQTLAYLRNANEDKSNIANSIISKLTSKVYAAGFGGLGQTLDVTLEKMTVSLLRDDIGALISIGFSVFETVETVPVGLMEGRAQVNGAGYVCDYEAERAAVIATLYE